MFKKIIFITLMFVVMFPVLSKADQLQTTISANQSESSPINLGKYVDAGRGGFFGIYMPSGWTTANITFKVSRDGGVTWQPVYDTDHNVYTVNSPNANDYIILSQPAFAGLRYIKLVSGTTSTPVIQTASRTIYLEYGKF